MLERVIEEKARGNPAAAAAIRTEIQALIGDDLSKLKPGSEQAMALKQVLIAQGAWSQYLEVGIGPDAEVFTKCPPMAAVGWGATVGLHPISTWNNPEVINYLWNYTVPCLANRYLMNRVISL